LRSRPSEDDAGGRTLTWIKRTSYSLERLRASSRSPSPHAETAKAKAINSTNCQYDTRQHPTGQTAGAAQSIIALHAVLGKLVEGRLTGERNAHSITQMGNAGNRINPKSIALPGV